MLFIDFHVLLVSSLCVILHMIEMTCKMHENNVNNLAYVCEPCHKSLKMLTQILLTSFVQSVRTSINGFSYILMDNSNMAMLSMEPKKRIISLYSNYCLTSYSISCRHITYMMLQLLANQMLHVLL